MTHLALRFLGGFEVAIDAEPITAFGADKVRALLAFLAIESSLSHRRAKLSAMFWPDFPEKKAAHNLSQSLLRLRKGLQEKKGSTDSSFLIVTSQNIQFNTYSDYQFDVLRFRELLNLCNQHNHAEAANCDVCAQWRSEAMELYQGDLLAGFFVPDSVAFEEWRLIQQEGLHRQALETLDWLAAYHEMRGEFDRVQTYTRQQIALEPWSEEAHGQLMRALAQSGQPAAALKQYDQYQQILAEELDINPSAAITALYSQILSGELVHQAVPQPDARKTVWLSSEGEHRQVTALVCSQGVQDEWGEVVGCERTCQAIFNRFGGRRAPRQGDTCLVYFGYPQAYEDAARRAVHAGLALTAVLKDNESVRIGIHTGRMVVGKKRGPRWQDRDLFGKTLEVARDCQRLAGSGEVVITEETKRLVQESFDLQVLGPQNLRATGELAQTYRVCGEGGAQSRLEWLVQTQRLTIFTGREAELRQLQNFYEVMLQGTGQAVFVRGEAGSGKSRLIWELKQRVPIIGESDNGMTNNIQSALWLTSRCLPHLQQTSLYPMIGLLEQLLGFRADDSVAVRQEKLDGMLAWYEMKRPFTIWLFSLLLGLPLAEPAPETITKAQREQMRKLFMTLLQKRAAEQPLVLLVEDLHWSDPSTLDWLGHLMEVGTAVPCLTLLTARPNCNPEWLSHEETQSKLHLLTLKPLRPEQAARMIADLAGDSMLDAKLRRTIVTRTDGVPLFVEELTKTLLERAADRGEANTTAKIPATLHDSLVARLDHLGEAKETVQWAAVLGREFSYPVLQACASYDEQRLQNDLARLVEAELVAPIHDGLQTVPTRYTFKHALMQDAAYASLLKRTRQTYHRRIAETLELHFPQVGETRPEVLGQHYFDAGLPVKAVNFWLLAGERAVSQGATLEAKTFFDRALEWIEPDDNERRWQALLGREKVLGVRGGRDEQEADLQALLTLAEAFDDDVRRSQVYLRQTSYAAMKGEYRASLPLAEAAIAAARRAGDVTLALNALAYKTQTLVFFAEMDPARQGVEEILAHVDDLKDNSVRALALTVAAQYYMEAGDLARSVQFQSQSAEAARLAGNHTLETTIRTNLGLIYATLGLYTQARNTLEAEVARTEEIGDRRLHASVMCHLGYVYGRSDDKLLARQVEKQALKELTEMGDAYGEATSLTYLGCLLEEAGELMLAAKYLTQARTGYAELGLEADKFEVQAIEARVALAQGQRETAEQLTVEVWNYLSQYGSEGFSWPSLVYLCVADVLDSVLNPNASLLHEVIEAGYHDLMQRTEKISDLDWRQSFLEQVSENKSIVVQWEGLRSLSSKPANG